MEFLLARGRLEHIAPEAVVEASDAILLRAEARLASSQRARAIPDVAGSFAIAYDAYRMAGDALLARQALRATGGEGSHMAVEDAIAAQFGDRIPAFVKPTFERFRRTRHQAQYFDITDPPITEEDADWAIRTAVAAFDGLRSLVGEDLLAPFD